MTKSLFEIKKSITDHAAGKRNSTSFAKTTIRGYVMIFILTGALTAALLFLKAFTQTDIFGYLALLVPFLGFIWLIYFTVHLLRNSGGEEVTLDEIQLNPFIETLIINPTPPTGSMEMYHYIAPIILWGLEEGSLDYNFSDEEDKATDLGILGYKYVRPTRDLIIKLIDNGTESAKFLSKTLFQVSNEVILYQKTIRALTQTHQTLNNSSLQPLYTELTRQSASLYDLGLAAKKSKISMVVEQYMVESPTQSFYEVREQLIDTLEKSLLEGISSELTDTDIYRLVKEALLLGLEEYFIEYLRDSSPAHGLVIRDADEILKALRYIFFEISSNRDRNGRSHGVFERN